MSDSVQHQKAEDDDSKCDIPLLNVNDNIFALINDNVALRNSEENSLSETQIQQEVQQLENTSDINLSENKRILPEITEITEISESALAIGFNDNWDDEINSLINSAKRNESNKINDKVIEKPTSKQENHISNVLEELLASSEVKDSIKTASASVNSVEISEESTLSSEINSIPLLDEQNEINSIISSKIENSKNSENSEIISKNQAVNQLSIKDDSRLINKISSLLFKYWRIILVSFICLFAIVGYLYWQHLQIIKKTEKLIMEAAVEGGYAFPRNLDLCLNKGLDYYRKECGKGQLECISQATEKFALACVNKQAQTDINKLECNQELDQFNLQCGVAKYCSSLAQSVRSRCQEIRDKDRQIANKSQAIISENIVTNNIDNSNSLMPINPKLSAEHYQKDIAKQAINLINNSTNSIDKQLEYQQNQRTIEDFLNYSQRIAQPLPIKASKYATIK